MIDKKKLLELIIEDYENKLQQYQKAMDDAQKEANFHKGAMESRYDTFKEEALMLKEGLAKQFKEVQEVLKILSSYKFNILNKKYNKVLPGSIVRCLIDDEEKYFFIIKNIMLDEYKIDNKIITTLNSDAPLAKKMLNLEEGDEFEFNNSFVEILEIM